MIPADLVTTLVIPLLSLAGLLAGVILSYIAQEEVSAGRKYFIITYRVIFILLLFAITWFLSFPLIIFFLFSAIILFALDLKKYYWFMFIVHYVFFLAGYFLSGKQVIVAVVLFLYGRPVGTLLRIKDE